MTGLKDCNKHLKPKVREFFGKYEKGKDKPAVNPLNKREGEPALIQYEKQTKQKIKKSKSYVHFDKKDSRIPAELIKFDTGEVTEIEELRSSRPATNLLTNFTLFLVAIELQCTSTEKEFLVEDVKQEYSEAVKCIEKHKHGIKRKRGKYFSGDYLTQKSLLTFIFIAIEMNRITLSFRNLCVKGNINWEHVQDPPKEEDKKPINVIPKLSAEEKLPKQKPAKNKSEKDKNNQNAPPIYEETNNRPIYNNCTIINQGPVITIKKQIGNKFSRCRKFLTNHRSKKETMK